MARTAGVRVSTVKVNFNDRVVANYSSADIMQLCRSAKQRSGIKKVPFAGLDELYNHVTDYLTKKPVCDCCGGPFLRKSDGTHGGDNKHSLSLHRVVASQGYVPSNIRIICQGCNNAIGEIQNMDDVADRMNALVWQTKIMEGGA